MTRKRFLWFFLLVVYGGAIFVLSGLRLGAGPPFLVFPGRDWMLHAIEFGLFFLLARNAIGRTSLALALTAAYAGSDELHQAFVPTRDASLVDWVFDLLGACAAAVAHEVACRSCLLARIRSRILDFRASRRERGT
ncbi:MAG: VanZ family protein [Candidatus Bipolaricaulia bacterium]